MIWLGYYFSSLYQIDNVKHTFSLPWKEKITLQRDFGRGDLSKVQSLKKKKSKKCNSCLINTFHNTSSLMTYNNSCFKAILGSQEICKIVISVLTSVLNWKARKGCHSLFIYWSRVYQSKLQIFTVCLWAFVCLASIGEVKSPSAFPLWTFIFSVL